MVLGLIPGAIAGHTHLLAQFDSARNPCEETGSSPSPRLFSMPCGKNGDDRLRD
jgi:hypothetical protein